MPIIAYDPQIFSSQTHGGISRYFCEISSRIGRFPGVKTTIVAPLHINSYVTTLSSDLVSGFKLPQTRFTRALLRKLAMLVGDRILRSMNPDIIHETYYYPSHIGPRSAKRVLTIYDMIDEKFKPDFHGSGKTSSHKALAAKRADHIICISEATRHDAVEILGLPIDQTSVIHLGFGLMEGDDETSKAPILGKPFLLYVGNRGGYKNFLMLLRALATSKQFRTQFRLICFGGGAFSVAETKAIRSYGLGNEQVIYLAGHDKVLGNLYRNASAFVYPSLYEGFGIPPLEAMSFGCPVVCSNTSAIPEVVGNAGKYFDPHDPESMRLAIERVLESNQVQEDLRAKGRLRLAAFSWDRCAADTLDTSKKQH